MLKAALGDCAYNNEEDEKEQEDQEQEARPGAGGEGEVHAEDEEDRATGSTRLSAHDESPVPEGHGQAPAPAMPLPRLNEATEPSPPADVSSHPASLDHGAQGEGHGVAASRAGTPTQGEGRDTLGPLSPRSRLNSCPPRPGTQVRTTPRAEHPRCYIPQRVAEALGDAKQRQASPALCFADAVPQEYRNRISVATQRATRLLDNLAGGGGGAGPTSDPLDGTDGTARLSSPGAAAGEGAPAAASNLLVLGHSDGGADAPTEHHAAHLPRVPPHAAAAPPPRALTGGLTASILQRTIARDLGLVPAPSAGDRLRAAMFTAAVPPHPYHAPQPHGCVSKEGSIAGQAGGGDTARAAKRETALAVLREHNLVELFSAIAAHDAPAPATGDIDAQLPQQSSGQRLPVLLPPVSPSSPCLPSLGAASLSGRGAAAAATGQLHHSGSENNLTLHVLQHMQHHPHPQQHHTHPHPQQGHKPQRGPPPQAPPDAHGEEGGAAHSAPLVTLKPRPSLVLPAEPPLLQGPASCSLVPGGGAGVAGHLASLRAHSGSGPLQLLKLRPHDLNASLGAARPPRESQGSPTPQGSAGRSVWERLTSETRRSAIGSTMSLEQVSAAHFPGVRDASISAPECALYDALCGQSRRRSSWSGALEPWEPAPPARTLKGTWTPSTWRLRGREGSRRPPCSPPLLPPPPPAARSTRSPRPPAPARRPRWPCTPGAGTCGPSQAPPPPAQPWALTCDPRPPRRQCTRLRRPPPCPALAPQGPAALARARSARRCRTEAQEEQAPAGSGAGRSSFRRWLCRDGT